MKNHTAVFDVGIRVLVAECLQGEGTPLGEGGGTHTCPSSWAMVKAALSPFSSLMEQLREGSHRVPSSAKPKKFTHTYFIKMGSDTKIATRN